jgi:hypothetical protein
MATVENKIRPKRVGRPSDRKNEVVDFLRDSILAGRLQPGSRMPTREQIIKQFSASPVTVNNALSELREGGFVEVRGNQGTFVAGSLPHQTRYAVAFGMAESRVSGNGYTSSLAKECALVKRTVLDDRELEIVPFFGVDRMWDSPDYIRLMADVRAHRIGGIIAANYIDHVVKGEDVLASRVPVVAHARRQGNETWSTMEFDGTSVVELAYQFLRSRGARRPAILVSVKADLISLDRWLDRSGEYGVTIEPHLIQMAHLDAPVAARNIANLMMRLHPDSRPDSLVIIDDNLVPHAVAGLMDAGMTAENAFPIVAQANFPWPTECALPALRVGYDLREMLNSCVRIIDRMRANNGVVEHAVLTATSLSETDQ